MVSDDIRPILHIGAAMSLKRSRTDLEYTEAMTGKTYDIWWKYARTAARMTRGYYSGLIESKNHNMRPIMHHLIAAALYTPVEWGVHQFRCGMYD